MTVFFLSTQVHTFLLPSPPFPPFSFHPYAYPKGLYFYSQQSSSVIRSKMAAEACIANFKKQLSLAPNIYACTAGHVLPSILYNHHYSPHSLMGSIYLSQFKLTRI